MFTAPVVMNKEFAILNRGEQRRMLERLETAPETQKPLTGPLVGYRRYRCDDKRVVFKIDDASSTVVVIAVGYRRNSEVYGIAASRV